MFPDAGSTPAASTTLRLTGYAWQAIDIVNKREILHQSTLLRSVPCVVRQNEAGLTSPYRLRVAGH